MKYADLRSGGVALAAALAQYRRAERTIVLGIVRGGVTQAHEVARTLELPLDVVLLRPMMQRLPAAPVCAAWVAGALVLDDELTAMTAHPAQTAEEIFVAEALATFAEREKTCRGARRSLNVAGCTVLLVDNGLRTGGTMRSAIHALRRLNPARIVAAVPSGSSDAVTLVTPLADALICLASPEPYGHVGMWYQRFDVGSERDICELLKSFPTI
jgi:putative phosphoribosyl transferase